MLFRDHVFRFYNTHIKPVLQCSIIVYGNAIKTQLERLSLLQRKAIRAVFAMSKHSSVDQVRIRSKILAVPELISMNL